MRKDLRSCVPGRYWIWVGAASCAALGAQAAIFGLSWSAAERSPALAGAVLATAVAPRVGLALLGGSVADRHGPLGTVVAAGSTAIVLALGGSLLGLALHDPTWLLFALALGLGTVSAFQAPASGAMPRLLVPVESLPRAMAATQVALQATTFVSAPLAGLAVAMFGLRGPLLLSAGTALVTVLLAGRIGGRVDSRPAGGARRSHLRLIADGLRFALREPVLRDLVLLLLAVAGFLIPVTSLLIPLLAREHGWGPATAGTTAAGIAAGSAAVSITVLAYGGLRRPGLAISAGLALAAAGLAALSANPGRFATVTCAVLIGMGIGLFASHAGPLLMGTAPATHVARVQAIMLLAQSLPLLLANNAIGLVVMASSASAATLCCAAGTVLAAALAAGSPAIRRAGRT